MPDQATGTIGPRIALILHRRHLSKGHDGLEGRPVGPQEWSDHHQAVPEGSTGGNRGQPREAPFREQVADHRLGLVAAVMGQQQDLEPPRTSDVGEGLPPGLRAIAAETSPPAQSSRRTTTSMPRCRPTPLVRGIVVRSRSEGVIDMTDDEWSRNRLSPSLAEPRPRGRASRSNRRHR